MGIQHSNLLLPPRFSLTSMSFVITFLLCIVSGVVEACASAYPSCEQCVRGSSAWQESGSCRLCGGACAIARQETATELAQALDNSGVSGVTVEGDVVIIDKDKQVKLRIVNIELQQIETLADTHPAVAAFLASLYLNPRQDVNLLKGAVAFRGAPTKQSVELVLANAHERDITSSYKPIQQGKYVQVRWNGRVSSGESSADVTFITETIDEQIIADSEVAPPITLRISSVTVGQ